MRVAQTRIVKSAYPLYRSSGGIIQRHGSAHLGGGKEGRGGGGGELKDT